ncbi:MAG TPA: VTT domain-containing protein [Acidobacteriaceae bacterium]|nr:VTT domain-containing protein [Acidobacteriaceae bacterium]
MAWVMSLFLRHAYAVMFGWVLVEQAGLPIPSVPLMLAAGTMSAAHKLHIAFLLPVVLLACLLSDSLWFWLGRRFGSRVLDLLCRFSFEASTCLTRTQGSIARRGAITLLFAKFVPGLSTLASPIAGQAGVSYWEFVAYELLGTLGWASAWLFAGRFFGDLARRSDQFFGTLTHFAGGLVLLMILGVIAYRYMQRRRFLTELQGLRLEPVQLLEMIHSAKSAGEQPPFIVDLRHALDVLADPLILPGAMRIGPDELKQRREMIPLDRDVVLYCTCPSEQTSAKVALELRKMGVRRVRPLRGGLQGWKDAGYPLEHAELVPVAMLTQS